MVLNLTLSEYDVVREIKLRGRSIDYLGTVLKQRTVIFPFKYWICND